MAREWWIYYVAIAPIYGEMVVTTRGGNKVPTLGPAFVIEEEGDDKEMFNEQLKLDVDHKHSAILILVENKPEEIAKLLVRDEKALDQLHLLWAQTLMRTLFEAKKQTRTVELKAREVHHKYSSLNQDDNSLDALAAFKFEVGRIISTKNNVTNRRTHLETLIRDRTEEQFVKKAIRAFPKDGASVHEYLMKSGFDSKEKCRDVLGRVLVRKKETEYLFKGLPPFEKKAASPRN